MSVKKLPSLTFNAGEYVVYPDHGVGKVVGVTKEKIAGSELECLVINFSKDKMSEKLPTYRIASSGLRKISDEKTINEALEVLKGKAKAKKLGWNRRKDEYGRKINSGNPVAVAEVIRDLYRSENIAEQSFSEGQTYKMAVERLATEYSVYNNCSLEDANKQLEDILSKARSLQTSQS